MIGLDLVPNSLMESSGMIANKKISHENALREGKNRCTASKRAKFYLYCMHSAFL